MEWYLSVVRDNYANFDGRARRKEYWMFALFNVIFSFIAMIVDNILGTTFGFGEGNAQMSMPYGWIYILYCLAMIIPSFAVFIRRLHDVDKSGWWLFLALIPFVGVIWLFVLTCIDGNPSANIYGPSPKVVS